MPESKYTTVIITGNGFDLNLGLKTGYADFLKSPQFNELANQGYNLYTYLKNRSGHQNWVDIENELKNFSNKIYKHPDREKFRMEYLALCQNLCNYINSLSLNELDKSSYVYTEIISKLIRNNECLILNYNYTNTIKHILKTDFPEIDHCKIINVHGSAANNSIVFGVEDSANINDDDIFLLKTVNKYYTVTKVYDILKNAKDIFIVGHSLGETDHSYFRSFFRDQLSEYSKSKKILLTCYKEPSRLSIMKQVRSLVGSRILELRSYNDFTVLDISQY